MEGLLSTVPTPSSFLRDNNKHFMECSWSKALYKYRNHVHSSDSSDISDRGDNYESSDSIDRSEISYSSEVIDSSKSRKCSGSSAPRLCLHQLGR